MRPQKKRKNIYEMVGLHKRSQRRSLQELSRAVGDRTLDVTHSQGRQESQPTQRHVAHTPYSRPGPELGGQLTIETIVDNCPLLASGTNGTKTIIHSDCM